MKCRFCGELLSEEMLDQGICFNCANPIVSEEEFLKIKEAEKKKEEAEKKKREAEERAKAEERAVAEWLAKIEKEASLFKKNNFLTTANSIEGHKVVAYKGIISGDIVLGTGFFSETSAAFADFFGISSNLFSRKMKQAKAIAENEMINNALAVGANAVIGIDVDYQTIGNNMIAVSMNGTAVVVEADN